MTRIVVEVTRVLVETTRIVVEVARVVDHQLFRWIQQVEVARVFHQVNADKINL